MQNQAIKPLKNSKTNQRIMRSGYDFTKRPHQANIEKLQHRTSKNPLTDVLYNIINNKSIKGIWKSFGWYYKEFKS